MFSRDHAVRSVARLLLVAATVGALIVLLPSSFRNDPFQATIATVFGIGFATYLHVRHRWSIRRSKS